ncbi:uncharacterized protein VTP21DRAFT_7318 [Calcarisporiella thermophila]|uniref:uncharacterized protein n=1 Tax=Calcarisporiella thermophila TaxID=911321 RepID=UPI003743D826
MSLKYEIETWHEAVVAFENKDYEKSIEIFSSIAGHSKIFFNIGLILSNMNQLEEAVLWFNNAVELDQYHAIAQFQLGITYYLLGNMIEAERFFDIALHVMRGNTCIDYTQLGLNHKLYTCEVIFNRGLTRLNRGDFAGGMDDLRYAQLNKETEEHEIIDRALENEGLGFTVISIPPGKLYRPPEYKVKNTKRVDYLGNAQVIANIDEGDTTTGFQPQKPSELNSNNITIEDGPFGKSAILPPSDQDAVSAFAEEKCSPNALLLSRANTVHTLPSLAKKPMVETSELKRLKTVAGVTTVRQDTFGMSRPPPPRDHGSLKDAFSSLSLNDSLPQRTTSMGKNHNLIRQNTLPPSFSSRALLYRQNTMPNMKKSPLKDLYSTSRNGADHDGSVQDLYTQPKSLGMDDYTNNYNQVEHESFSEPNDDYFPYIPPQPPQIGLQRRPPLGLEREVSLRSLRSINIEGKTRVKCYLQSEPDTARAFLLDDEATFADLVTLIQKKFNTTSTPLIKYRDDEGELVLIVDDSDLLLARNVAVEMYGGVKLELFISID